MNTLVTAETPCENYFMGCPWYGERHQMNDHVLKECEYACFECVNKTCKRVFARKDILEHMAECSYNNIMCKACGWGGHLCEADVS